VSTRREERWEMMRKRWRDVLILENQSPRNQEGGESMGAGSDANSCVQSSLWFNVYHSFWCIQSFRTFMNFVWLIHSIPPFPK
jgi:hypothetical protein